MSTVWKERLKRFRVVVRLQSWWKYWSHRGETHDEVYGSDYFAMVDETSGRSAPVMAQSIVTYLHPSSVIDMGCGAGNLLEALRELGVAYQGLELSAAGLERCRSKNLNVVPFDFTDPSCLARSFGDFDLAVSQEVAMQLPPGAVAGYLDFLCRHSNTVLFSSPPCANDRRPLSPFPTNFWIGQFESRGFKLDAELSDTLRQEWLQNGTAVWHHRQPLLFRNSKT